ncbi:unnamed protein product, partial [Polarella glacialis]
DLGALGLNHNEIIRRHASGPLRQSQQAMLQQVTAAQKVRELNGMLGSLTGSADNERNERGPGRSQSETALPARHLVRPLHFEDQGPLAFEGKGSRARMLHLAEQMKHAGPGRVQLIARAAGISVSTCRRL